VRPRNDRTGRVTRRVWWQFRPCTLLITSPLFTLLLVVALTSSPFWWKARTHDVAVLMHSHNAQSRREMSVARPDEAAVYLRFAQQAEARVAYHQKMSRKYWHIATRPWLWGFVPAHPPPPP